MQMEDERELPRGTPTKSARMLSTLSTHKLRREFFRNLSCPNRYDSTKNDTLGQGATISREETAKIIASRIQSLCFKPRRHHQQLRLSIALRSAGLNRFSDGRRWNLVGPNKLASARRLFWELVTFREKHEEINL